jgi:UDP-GlcNAc:undecaprenyl-phosphate GlcNAc-1-phosphate transferase
LFLTLLTRKVALRYGKIAKPQEDRWHSKPTALLGGVAIYFTFLIAALIFVIPIKREFLGILAGGTFLFALGVVDDLQPVKPYTKLIAQIIAAVVAILFGIRMEMFTPLISVPLTILWIVAITNAFNLLDNMDGLSAGIAFITALVLSVLSGIQDRWELVTISLIIAGTSLGFLRHNFNPASIFMGDCGSMFLGFTIGALSIVGTYQHASNLIVTIAVPVLIMAVPIFDTLLVTVMRNLTGRAVSRGGKDHISHRLVVLGLSERQSVLLLYSLSIITGAIAIMYPHFNLYMIIVIGALVLVGLFLLGVFLGETKVYSKEELDVAKEKIMGKKNKVVLDTTIFYKRQIVEVFVDFVLIVVAYVSAYLLRFEGTIPEGDFHVMIESFPILILVQFASFYYFGLYKKIWRYIGLSDVVSIFKAVTLGTLITVFVILLITRFYGYSRAVFVIYWLILIILATSTRGAIRLLREHFADIQKTRGRKVLIFGAGDAGSTLLREIKNNPELHYKVVGFIDDDLKKIGRKIYDKTVIGSGTDLSRIAKEKNIEEILIAISSLSEEGLQRIQALCEESGLSCRRMGRIL